jgi:hypothetical protein
MKVRFLILAAIVLTATALSVALGGDSQQQTSDENSNAGVVSAKELYAMVKKPTTPVELLKNIKFALDHELLLREDFYTDGTLKQFIGGTRVEWPYNRPTSKSAKVSGLGDLYQATRGAPRMGIDVRLYPAEEDGKIEDHRKIGAAITVQMGRGLTVEDVEGVLGVPTKVSDRHGGIPGPHPEPGQPKTHPFGNTVIVYPLDKPTSKGRITFTIDGDGTVNRYNAYSEVK